MFLTLTTTFAVGFMGIVNVIAVELQLVGVISSLPNFTVLVPCAFPKPVPLTVTEVSICPELGERFEMTGVTVKSLLVLLAPATVMVMFPVVAQDGTVNWT